jgi:hypothetical protein
LSNTKERDSGGLPRDGSNKCLKKAGLEMLIGFLHSGLTGNAIYKDEKHCGEATQGDENWTTDGQA